METGGVQVTFVVTSTETKAQLIEQHLMDDVPLRCDTQEASLSNVQAGATTGTALTFFVKMRRTLTCGR